MKKRISIALAFVLVLSLAACSGAPASQAPSGSQSTAPSPAPSSSDEPLEIAVVVKITGIPFFNVYEEGVERAAKELGVNAYVTGPTDADPAQQVKIVEDLINTGVDAIVVVPNDATALEAVLKRAQEKGIVVIANESPGQSGADYDIEMIDNKKFAITVAEEVAKAAGGKGDYVVYVGGLSVPLHNTWADYAVEYLKENYPDMKEATDRIPCGEDADLAHTKTLELLKTYPDLKGIIGWGSLGPIGAAQVSREKGLIGKLAIAGTVVPSQASQYLKDGSITQGVLWNPADSGFAAVFTAKALLQGEKAENVDVPGIGKPTVMDGNVLSFDATLVITAENADSLGF